MSDYPKYQADWTVGTRMFHVRCDDIEEFHTAVRNMEAMMPSNKPFPDDEGNHATAPEKAVNAPECAIHHTPMKWKAPGVSRSGKPYAGFWSCGTKNDDGTWCRYKPA